MTSIAVIYHLKTHTHARTHTNCRNTAGQLDIKLIFIRDTLIYNALTYYASIFMCHRLIFVPFPLIDVSSLSEEKKAANFSSKVPFSHLFKVTFKLR